MPAGPLSPYRILDLSRVLAGPFCTMQLADLGAEVIKVEVPGKGDDTRSWGPPFLGGESSYFLSTNRGKRSLTLNLKDERGLEILWRLLADSDVLVENFRPGTMDRLGLGYPAVAARCPRLVYCSISGFGATGPERHRPGYDVLVQGESGLMSLTGAADGPPFKLGVSISDLTAGMAACQGILAALLERERSGEGQRVDISMLDVSVSLLTYQAGLYFATGQPPGRRGNDHPSLAPYATYPCADGTLIIAVGNDALFTRLCAALDLPELPRDPRFATAAARVENRQALDENLKRVLAGRRREEWLARLREQGVPSGAVKAVDEALASPQLAARGMVQRLTHPRAGAIGQLGSPLHLGEHPNSSPLPPPMLGEHTEEILAELGLSSAAIEELRRAGVV